MAIKLHGVDLMSAASAIVIELDGAARCVITVYVINALTLNSKRATAQTAIQHPGQLIPDPAPTATITAPVSSAKFVSISYVINALRFLN
jgi:hypothetical protein